MARTLAALRAAADEPAAIPVRRRKTMFTIMKTAAAVLLATAAGLLYVVSFPTESATAEFKAAALKLQDAHTLSLRQTAKVAALPTQVALVYYKVPGLVRTEVEAAGGSFSILDMTHGKTLIVNPAEKSALLLEEPPGENRARKLDPAGMMIEGLRQLAQKEGQPAGEKVVGEIHARGFLVKEHGQDLTVWIDPQKKLPLQIEAAGRASGLEFHITYSDIRLDPKLDESLFRLEPPAGYTVRKSDAKLIMTPDEAIVKLLRRYAEHSGGSFPSRIDDFNTYKQAFSPMKGEKVVEAAAFESATISATVAAFTLAMKDRFGYKADGIKLGDAESIIFWYKLQGQATYRVIYGDLHTGDVAADKLPEKPKF
jgi:outer membrane lipoprotein-sorting protein